MGLLPWIGGIIWQGIEDRENREEHAAALQHKQEAEAMNALIRAEEHRRFEQVIQGYGIGKFASLLNIDLIKLAQEGGRLLVGFDKIAASPNVAAITKNVRASRYETQSNPMTKIMARAPSPK